MSDKTKTDQPQQGSRKWGHGLFGCCDDPLVCLSTWWFPCYTFGTNALILGKPCCLCAWAYTVPGLNCVVHYSQRRDVRLARGIPGGIGGDLVAVLCCPMCALCQEANELRDIVGEKVDQLIVQQPQSQGVFIDPLANANVIIIQPSSGLVQQPQATLPGLQQLPSQPVQPPSELAPIGFQIPASNPQTYPPAPPPS